MNRPRRIGKMAETKYIPEKWVWTEADFEQMSWHDCKIHAMAFVAEANFQHEFVLDVDYIFEWVYGDDLIHFWISPATLVFENYNDLCFAGENFRYYDDPQIDQIFRVEDHWKIATVTGGSIEFSATGFKQYIRRAPALINHQILSLKERGGLSFDRLHP